MRWSLGSHQYRHRFSSLIRLSAAKNIDKLIVRSDPEKISHGDPLDSQMLLEARPEQQFSPDGNHEIARHGRQSSARGTVARNHEHVERDVNGESAQVPDESLPFLAEDSEVEPAHVGEEQKRHPHHQIEKRPSRSTEFRAECQSYQR